MNEQSNDIIIEQPPFPLLTKQSGSFEGTDTFASWQNFQAGDEDLPNEVIRIVVNLENPNDELPSVAQTNAYNFLKENEALITQKITEGLFVDYPQIRVVYEGIEPEYIPEIDQPADFRRLIKPINIHINSESMDEFAYIGFEFDCLWDIEHGLGVMMHKTKYIGCNDAEAAWNLALAQK
jgi:hypothetical protein